MTKHKDHDRHCDHKIAYCKKCDTAYCEYNGCSAEWTTEPCNLNHYPYQWYKSPTITTPNITWTNTTDNESFFVIDSSDDSRSAPTIGSCDHN